MHPLVKGKKQWKVQGQARGHLYRRNAPFGQVFAPCCMPSRFFTQRQGLLDRLKALHHAVHCNSNVVYDRQVLHTEEVVWQRLPNVPGFLVFEVSHGIDIDQVWDGTVSPSYSPSPSPPSSP